jgi:2-oxoisovalerate dehydrogenase E1 component alpha subunit
VAVTYFGDGAASEGDFHSALNFAATLRSQTMFICRNNGYAISTPVDDQFAGEGISPRGVGYGMHTLRVDGNDALAVHAAVREARELIIKEKKPVLLELMSYRVGDHSTSDFSQRYRDDNEMKKWNAYLKAFGNPIDRLEKFLLAKKWIEKDYQTSIREDARNQVRHALKTASSEKLPPIDELFTDVYDEMTPDLIEQKAELEAHLKKYPEAYKVTNFKDGEKYL